ncbi:hypothetical protein BaRGS_00020352 [Batillaria attramentaria]|uniref:Uncharacterized protein n=1 Tax=Batillaria attramentaria TaxID=370345 RepID=A0ABD0KM81_9CAEN
MQQTTFCTNRLPRSLNPFGMSRVLGEPEWEADDSCPESPPCEVSARADRVRTCHHATDAHSDGSLTPSSFADETRMAIDHIDSVIDDSAGGDNNVIVGKNDERLTIVDEEGRGGPGGPDSEGVCVGHMQETADGGDDDGDTGLGDVTADDDVGEALDMSMTGCDSQLEHKQVSEQVQN